MSKAQDKPLPPKRGVRGGKPLPAPPPVPVVVMEEIERAPMLWRDMLRLAWAEQRIDFFSRLCWCAGINAEWTDAMDHAFMRGKRGWAIGDNAHHYARVLTPKDAQYAWEAGKKWGALWRRK